MYSIPSQILTPSFHHHAIAPCGSLRHDIRHAARCEHSCARNEPCDGDDCDSCEFDLNTARLEVARLRSLLHTEMQSGLESTSVGPQPSASCESTKPQGVTYARKAYAPPALGTVTPRRQVLPRHQLPPLMNVRMVTNIGSLIDVLL